jgi:hypothetical protein
MGEHKSKLFRVDADDNAAERGFASTWAVIRFCLWVFGAFCLLGIILAVIGIAHIIPG